MIEYLSDYRFRFLDLHPDVLEGWPCDMRSGCRITGHSIGGHKAIRLEGTRPFDWRAQGCSIGGHKAIRLEGTRPFDWRAQGHSIGGHKGVLWTSTGLVIRLPTLAMFHAASCAVVPVHPIVRSQIVSTCFSSSLNSLNSCGDVIYV